MDGRRAQEAAVTGTFTYPEAEALEKALGDPLEASSPLSFASARALDEADQLREPFFKALWDRGFARQYVPRAYGGALGDAAQSLAALRCVARRDVTAAHQLGNHFLGSLPIWIGGSEEQRRSVARRLLARQRMAFALTERAHGADVLANETLAEKTSGGYRLSGEKWLISQAATADALTVMARTGASGDPRGFSMFYFEKDSAGTGWRALPRVATLGLRGADISGIVFEGCEIPSAALIGNTGEALDFTIRTLFASKIMVTAFSLSAADTALRSVMAFGAGRMLYGSSVLRIPHARTVIAHAFSELLMADACFTLAARAMNQIPEQLSVHSNLTKVVVPEVCSQAIQELAHILGARFYLREGEDQGAFEKMQRDNAIIGVFDGSSIVCLSAISAQLRPLLSRSAAGEALERVSKMARLGTSLPDLDPSRIEIASRGKDDWLQSLEELLRREPGLRRAFGGEIRHSGSMMLDRVRSLPERLEAVHQRYGAEAHRTWEMYELAREYCYAGAAAAAIHLWAGMGDELGEFFAEGSWLALGLRRWAGRFGLVSGTGDPALTEAVFGEAEARWRNRKMFGVVPIQLA
jgi:alkylation response protein AidB-like acyl-CoA dehydrogenase